MKRALVKRLELTNSLAGFVSKPKPIGAVCPTLCASSLPNQALLDHQALPNLVGWMGWTPEAWPKWPPTGPLILTTYLHTYFSTPPKYDVTSKGTYTYLDP